MWGLEEKRLLLGWWRWRAATAMGSWSDACGGSVTCSILGRLKEVRKLRHKNACRTCYYFISVAPSVVRSEYGISGCSAMPMCYVLLSRVLLKAWLLQARCFWAGSSVKWLPELHRGLWAGGIQTYFCKGDLSAWWSLNCLLFKECLSVHGEWWRCVGKRGWHTALWTARSLSTSVWSLKIIPDVNWREIEF